MSAPGRQIRASGALRAFWQMASGLEQGRVLRAISRSILYRLAQAVCKAVPICLLVPVLDQLQVGAVTATRIWAYTVACAASLVAQVVFGYLSRREAWVGALGFATQIRLRVLDHLGRLPMSFHSSRHAGDSTATFTSDTAAIEEFTAGSLPTMVGHFGLPVTIIVVLLLIDLPLGLAVMASLVASIPVTFWTQRRFSRLAAIRQDLRAEATSRVVEYVQGIAVVRAHDTAGAAQHRLRSALDNFRAVNTRLVVQVAPLFGAFTAVVNLGIPIVITATAYRLLGGRIDVGTALVFLVLAVCIYQPVPQIFEMTEKFRLASASLDRVARLLETPAQPEPAHPIPVKDWDIEFDQVSFSYQTGVPVLHTVSFTAPASSMTAIVGPSGAGKTTVLNLVARFWDPDQGTVRIGGVDLRDLSTDQLFDAVSVVFQDVYLFAGTIFDNIALGRRDVRPNDVVAAAKAACCHDFITALPDGYQTAVGEGGHTLSGGERQRISIARAILKDAPIVLLDEATAAIDPINEGLIQSALTALTADKTLLVVAHRLSTVQAVDQILVIESGRIVQRGTHDELIACEGLYARFWANRRRASTWRLAGAASQELSQ